MCFITFNKHSKHLICKEKYIYSNLLCHFSLYLNLKLHPLFLLDNGVKMASKRRSQF